MIHSHEHFRIVQEQLNPIEDALASLRSRLLPDHPENFALYSEGYVDQIAQLRHQIDEYVGITPELLALSKSA